MQFKPFTREEMQQEQKAAKRLEGEAIVHHALGQAVMSDAALAELIDKYERLPEYCNGNTQVYRVLQKSILNST